VGLDLKQGHAFCSGADEKYSAGCKTLCIATTTQVIHKGNYNS
jgi:hypothetical protein